jgi:hypothetical protein
MPGFSFSQRSMCMEKIFTGFADVAAPVITERWREMRGGHGPEGEPLQRGDQVAAMVQLSLKDGATETVAHVALVDRAD